MAGGTVCFRLRPLMGGGPNAKGPPGWGQPSCETRLSVSVSASARRLDYDLPVPLLHHFVAHPLVR